ncbi:MAG: hypothetical protein EZS28_011997 [Streblomastix strix]|uniref:Uncharacterized protein n=1 Tax=Streblomastix strix TaxID=222440 RepID=A0A5J4WDF1_9EUKA|nr:MAG: hypothetical protein EZS28_011997 [Streblomastix strix]
MLSQSEIVKEKDQLDYEPIENAHYSSIAYGMYESRIWGTLTTQNSRPKFTGTPTNIPLNAVLFAQKVYGYPIDWTGSIPIDCLLIDKFKNKQMNPINETIIYSLEQLNINWHEIFKAIWEAAIKYACESKICR